MSTQTLQEENVLLRSCGHGISLNASVKASNDWSKLFGGRPFYRCLPRSEKAKSNEPSQLQPRTQLKALRHQRHPPQQLPGMDVRDASGTCDAMISRIIVFLGSASSLWISQSHGRVRAVSPQCRGVITGTITFRASASGQRLGPGQANLCLGNTQCSHVELQLETSQPACLAPPTALS